MSAGYKQSNIPLFNLLFALEIGIERGTVIKEEFEFFMTSFIKLPNYKKWRKADTSFVRITDKIDNNSFIRLKRNQLRLYPKRRSLFEEVGESVTTYRDMMGKFNSYFNSGNI